MTNKDIPSANSKAIPSADSIEHCLKQASRFLQDAAGELDGTKHAALWELTQGCNWLLQAVEQFVARETKGS